MKKTDFKGSSAQLRAIRHGAGAACVIAGPGSGKTFVIVQRIIALIEKGISPNEILVITFTKAAAIEMQHRFTKETNSMYPEVLFGTFHSIFYQIIRSGIKAGDDPVKIMKESDKYRCMNHVLKILQSKPVADNSTDNSCNLRQKGKIFRFSFDQDTITSLLSEISRIKNDGKKADCCDETIPLREYFKEIYDEYTGLLRELNFIDFEDMVLMCYEQLSSNPETLKTYQERFKYILIDEYQDINQMQFEVIKLLAGERQNIFVVGDDDQSIYGFRGSRPELMLSFKNIFPDAKEILLDKNYRCSPEILNASIKVIEENKNRINKKISSGIPDKRGIVKGCSFENRESEFLYILKSIRNRELSQCAIIFRTNVEAAAMAKFLMSENIPCCYRERVEFLHEKRPVSDMLSYLRFAFLGGKRSDFIVLMNQPLRYISRECLRYETVTENDVLGYYSSKGKIYMLEKIQKLFRDIEMIKKLRPYLAIHYVRKVIGYDKHICEKYAGDKKRLSEALSEIDNFMELSKKFRTVEELFNYIEEEKRIGAEIKTKGANSKAGVNIMTMHASKGLEFRTVYLPDLNEGVIPSRKSITKSEIEEERRMFYVAMTRAKKELYLSYVRGNKDNPMRASGFLRNIRDIFTDIINVEKGHGI